LVNFCSGTYPPIAVMAAVIFWLIRQKYENVREVESLKSEVRSMNSESKTATQNIILIPASVFMA
jgi:hypothetical protein